MIKPSILTKEEVRLVNKTSFLFNKYRQAYKIIIPSVLNRNSLSSFIKSTEFVFSGKQYTLPILIDFEKCKKISNIGLLLVYMIMKFSIERKIAPNYFFQSTREFKEDLRKRGFSGLYSEYVKEDEISPSQHLFFEISGDNFFMFPQRLSSMSELEQQNLNDDFLVKITEFYKGFNLEKVSFPIGTCVGELISNFWAHSSDKSDTYMLANGNKDKFNLYTVDNGKGILSSLREEYREMKNERLMRICIDKGVSSKRKKTMNLFIWGVDYTISQKSQESTVALLIFGVKAISYLFHQRKQL